MKYHPDQNPGDAAAEEKFKEAESLRGFIRYAEKAQYDQFGHQAFGAGGFGGGFNANDIFNSAGFSFEGGSLERFGGEWNFWRIWRAQKW